MKAIRASSEDEMIAEFLSAELTSARFGRQILDALKECGAPEGMVRNPDLHNKKENRLRRAVFTKYREYGSNRGLFENFPSDVRWERVSFTREEVKRIRYIDYSYWVELSGGSRLAADAALNIRRGVTAFGQSNDRFFEAAASLRSGGRFPPLIVVSKDRTSRIVVLEGHVRLTAYLLEPELMPKEIEALIGYSPGFTAWNLY